MTLKYNFFSLEFFFNEFSLFFFGKSSISKLIILCNSTKLPYNSSLQNRPTLWNCYQKPHYINIWQNRAKLLVLVKHFQSDMRGSGWARGGLYHWLILQYNQWLREGLKKIKLKKVNKLFTLGGGVFHKYGGRLVSTDLTPRRGQSKSPDVHVYITARSRWYNRQILSPFWFIFSYAQTDRVFVVYSQKYI